MDVIVMRLAAFLLLAVPLVAQAPSAASSLIFQTSEAWSPRVNVESNTAMVYGIDATMPQRIRSWRKHGYRVAVMTGVAWGRYGDYLRGDFDGKPHWNETQQEKSGKLILHSGREVPYISPTESYGRYLSQGVQRALEAGAEAIYLEEPEFWARAGWSDAFKAEWQAFYHQPWQAPDSSPDAQYRASKLKYFLYRRALAQVFDFVRQWSQQHGKSIPCYVATHSLINYAQWQIVSPESSLLEVGADGFIAQVWTGTSRQPNVYEGERKERTFETAFLEYGALQNIARSSGKRIWYLNDPIEDNPNHSWTDYRRNWESTLVASLLQPHVSSYEILPWPDRIFGPKGLYPVAEPTPANPKPDRAPIPSEYETELQTVFHALGQMDQAKTFWQTAGTQGLGVLASDTMMFQRAQPNPSDPDLGSFYGLALPLLMRGIPVEPVQIESTWQGNRATDFLKNYRLLLLTYEGQKPSSPKFHQAIAAWVKSGGALLVVDDDRDPYNHATDWWNTPPLHLSTPRQDLFHTLGLDPSAEGLHHVGKGVVLYAAKSPAALSHDPAGADTLRQLTHQAADAIHLPWKETSSLVLRRGPFVIASGLDVSEALPGAKPTPLPGTFVNLFDPHLALETNPTIAAGQRTLLLDPGFFPHSQPQLLAASAKITDLSQAAHSITFTASSIEGRDTSDLTAIRLLLPHPPTKVSIADRQLDTNAIHYHEGMLLLEFPAHATGQKVIIDF
jgi:hypothetical protein